MPLPLTATHWGTYRVESKDGRPTTIHKFEDDANPSSISEAMIDTLQGPCRIGNPMVRKNYLLYGPNHDRSLRGQDSFVEVEWDQALDLVAAELQRVKKKYGNSAIYGGSYGWASAGRFHHAQSQLRRFMNLYGGCTTSRDSYSYAAAEVILPHVVGSMSNLTLENTSWKSIAEARGLVVAFGGMAIRNSQVNAGGTGQHTQLQDMKEAKRAGVEFINVSPNQQDTIDELDAKWLAIRPNTDTALMLAIAYTLVDEKLYDSAFLNKYSLGFEKFLPYLMGDSDHQPKNALWAEKITDIPADKIVALARDMACKTTMINVSWSLTRQQNGEQPYWMAVVLAAMLGGIGDSGAGFSLGLSSINGVGNERGYLPWASLPRGKDPTDSFIPVARIADMLLSPGDEFKYNGKSYHYPDTHLVYWAGGNPFHHHQDLNRLRQAWQKIDTVIVHEPFWTPVARYADIVLPCTVGLERNDLAASPRDSYLIAMKQAAKPFQNARNDHDIFAGIASRLPKADGSDTSFEDAFRDGKNEDMWLRELYQESKNRGQAKGYSLPEYEEFMETGVFKLDHPVEPQVMLGDFKRDPILNPLTTPSGLIEIFSETIFGFGLEDNPGHPVWNEPIEWLGAELSKKYPLHLISHQPARRLHSQLDHSNYSKAGKLKNREPCVIHPDEAKKRQLKEGDLVRIYNDRGSCLSAIKLSLNVRRGVLMIATGAWYDPDYSNDAACCKHGNPNVLTPDIATSQIAQGPSAMSCLVEVELLKGDLAEVTAFSPPDIQFIKKN